jgi:hypothetical protein
MKIEHDMRRIGNADRKAIGAHDLEQSDVRLLDQSAVVAVRLMAAVDAEAENDRKQGCDDGKRDQRLGAEFHIIEDESHGGFRGNGEMLKKAPRAHPGERVAIPFLGGSDVMSAFGLAASCLMPRLIAPAASNHPYGNTEWI